MWEVRDVAAKGAAEKGRLCNKRIVMAFKTSAIRAE